MNYTRDIHTERTLEQLVRSLNLSHIDISRVVCVRSAGSKSRRTLARCHTLPKIMQKALNLPAHYIIEILSENYDRLSEEEKTKTLIHELLHIPKTFGGGFRHHHLVTRKTVDQFYRQYARSPE